MSEYEQFCIQQANKDFYLNIFMFLITFISVLLIYKDYKSRKSKESAEKSILIAEKFATNIISRISIISLSLKKIGLTNLIKHVKFTKFSEFDHTELVELYPEKDIKTYFEKINNEKIDITDTESISLSFFITETLNSLEYLCMYISTEVADGKYIYDSLHDIFFTIIHLLHIDIAEKNKDYKNVYYSNISSVFNTWKDEYLKSCKKEQKYAKKIKNKINKTK